MKFLMVVSFILSAHLAMAQESKKSLDSFKSVDELISSTTYQAQMDDPDLVQEISGEETLGQLQELEFQRESLSVGKAIALSLIPGGGWGLLYARKKAQSMVPLITSLIGYGVGAVYLSGQLDTKAEDVCIYKPTNVAEANVEVCSYYTPIPSDPFRHLEPDKNNPAKKYFETKGDYEIETRGTNYDGSKFGLQMLAGTYVVSSLIGAIWATVAVNEHNDEVRKKVESTAQLKFQFTPIVQYNGRTAQMGFGFNF